MFLQGGDGSVQALYNGFAGALHGSGQASNQAQNFHHPQVPFLIKNNKLLFCPYGNSKKSELYGNYIDSRAPSLEFSQGGSMQAQNYGAPATMMNQTPAATGSTGGAPAQPRQRVRARRGQATDPHSIAERVRFTLSSLPHFSFSILFGCRESSGKKYNK